MWSFSRQSTDNAGHNIAAHQANVRPSAEPEDTARIALRKFSGYSTEDPAKVFVRLRGILQDLQDYRY